MSIINFPNPTMTAERPTAAPVQVVQNSGFVPVSTEQRSYAAEPLKDRSDIECVQDYLISQGKYRDNLLFTIGINFGLRCGDLVSLRVGNVLSPDGTYLDCTTVIEQKTNKKRTLWLNDAVRSACDLYFRHHTETVDLNDLLFRGEGNRSKNSGKPLTVRSVERILKDAINKGCGIDIHASTHCMRKTFAYHQITDAEDRRRAVEFVQKLFGHSSQTITLMYAGITKEEVANSYRNLNLGQIDTELVTTNEEPVAQATDTHRSPVGAVAVS